MAELRPTQLVTGEVRISYEHLMKAYANQQGAEEKFSCTLLIPKSDIATKQKIDAAIRTAIQEGVSGKWNGAAPPAPPIPIYDGDGVRPSGEAFGPECKGHYVMTASSKLQPEIVDASRNPILSPSEIYSGMYAQVCINFFAYNAAGKKGIGCGLGPVMKTRDGEPLGGHISAMDVFGGTNDYQHSAPQPGYGAGYQAPPVQPGPPQAPQAPPAQPGYAPGYQPYPQQTPPQTQQSYQTYPQQTPPGYAPVDPVTGQPYGENLPY